MSNLDGIQVLTSIHEALWIQEWKEAVTKEIEALEKNETWVIAELPASKQLVGCKWILTVMYNLDGRVIYIHTYIYIDK